MDAKVTIAIIPIIGILLWVSGANEAIEKRDDVPRRDRYLLLDSGIIDFATCCKMGPQTNSGLSLSC